MTELPVQNVETFTETFIRTDPWSSNTYNLNNVHILKAAALFIKKKILLGDTHSESISDNIVDLGPFSEEIPVRINQSE